MKINLREPSTKRGLVMIITGCTVLYQTIWGSGQMNIDALFSRVDWWLGVGLNIVGMFGLLPDVPPRNPQERTRATDLPKIELQGHSESTGDPVLEALDELISGTAFVPHYRDPADRRLQPPSMSPERRDENGWNG